MNHTKLCEPPRTTDRPPDRYDGTPGHEHEVEELEGRLKEVEERLRLYGVELETHRRILRARGEEV